MGKSLFLALLLTITCSLGAQVPQLTGYVYDAQDGEPIAGATVRVDGSKKITVTDVDGKFVLNNLSAKEKKVTISFVGYESFNGDLKPDMKVYLSTKTELMDELIVVAFGKQKRESFTGSASVVGADQISRMQVTNPVEALNGTVTGLTMTETNSFSDDPSITIRGIGSLNADTEPLIVLDGMPYSGYLNDINPSDVASMTVLKDAASNALYGARGANGVILITTKNAQKGSTKVNLTAKWGANTNGLQHYDVITDPGQYYEAFYLAYKNMYMLDYGQSPGLAHVNANAKIGQPYANGGLGYVVYNVPKGETLIGTNGRLNPNATLGNRVVNNGEIYTLYPDDWEKEGIRNGFRQEYNVTLSSSNDRYSMYASLGYLDADGLAYNNDIERYSARLKADVQAYSFLKVGASASYNHTETNNNSSIFSVVTGMSPIYPLYVRDAYGNIMTDSRGKLYDYGNGNYTGLLRLPNSNANYVQDDMLDYNNRVSNAFSIQGYATVDFLDGFHFTINGTSYITESRYGYGYSPYYGYYTGTGNVSTYHYRDSSFNTQQLLNYSKNFGKNSLDVLLGHEYTNEGGTSLSGSRNKVVLYDENKELDGAITMTSNSGSKSQYNIEGWFLRAQYDYDSKYFASGSFRRDGSSNFAPAHRWGNFWSLGAAWIMTKEEWFPKTDMVNMLKLKVSYGEQGNDAIGSFRYTDKYNIRNADGNVAFVFSSKGNENITWETVGSFNAGVEFELFNSRLSGGLEFYTRTTRDMLMYFSTPLSIGYTGYYDNVGDMRNTGLELQLNANLLTLPNFAWDLSLNLSWERNRVTYLPEAKKLYTMDGYQGYFSSYLFYGEGLPVNTWRLPKDAGLDDQGRALYYVTNDDGTLSTTYVYEDADYYLCGSALPDVFGGFTTSFRFFGVDINAQFNYSIGGKKIDQTYSYLMSAPYAAYTGMPIHKDVFKAWTPENTNTDIPVWKFGYYTPGSYSSRYLTDASYIGLRNITVGYTFPKKLTRKIHMSNLRVYAQAENIYYWSKRKGFDPRMGALYGNYNSDSGYAFPMRTISGGVSIEF